MRTELYRFEEATSGGVTALTSGNREIIYNFETYEPTVMGRSDIEAVSELNKASLEVSLSINHSTAKRWATVVTEQTVTMVLYIQNDGVTTIAWHGRISNVRIRGKKVILVIDSSVTLLKRTGLRKRYQRSCPYALYDKGCNLSKESFAVSATVSSMGGITIIVPEAATYADDHFSGGIIEAADGSLRYISSHTGDTLTLLRELPGLVTGAVTIYPGCDRSRNVCSARFSNLDNFGGFPFIPLVNPFTLTSIA